MRTLSGRSAVMLTACLLLVLPRLVAGQGPIPAPDRQIAAAVLPAPAEMRDGATVWGYAPDGRFVSLRRGTNDMVCLAADPKAQSFHVACYHRSLEPFMARGRELRSQGVQGGAVDTARFAEVKSGKLVVPTHPAMLYSLTGGTYDAASNTAPGARHLYVTYIPFATPATTGLSAKPAGKTPWIMYPGTPKAHIMFMPDM